MHKKRFFALCKTENPIIYMKKKKKTLAKNTPSRYNEDMKKSPSCPSGDISRRFSSENQRFFGFSEL